MKKNIQISCSKEKAKEAISKMLQDKEVAKLGDLSEKDNGFSFEYSQFGTTKVDLTINAINDNSSEIEVNFNIAPAHKIVLTEKAVEENVAKYNSILAEKYLS